MLILRSLIMTALKDSLIGAFSGASLEKRGSLVAVDVFWRINFDIRLIFK